MPARRGVLAFVLSLVVLGLALVFVIARQLRTANLPATQPAVLVFEVPTTLTEGDPPAGSLFFAASRRRARITTYDVVRALRAAARDEAVTSLVLHVDALDWGWARVDEVRQAVADFRDSGKPVYASLAGGGEREYLLASAADVVAMPPTAVLQLDGLAATATFFRGTLDKIGVRPNFVRVGRFKSAAEAYTRTGMSPESREALGAVLDDLYRLLLDRVAEARGMEPDSVAALLERGPFPAGEARQLGLLDTLLYDTEVDSLALAGHGVRRRATTFARYLSGLGGSLTGPRVALVAAEGAIVDGRSRSMPGQEPDLGAETVIEALRAARTRSAIKAIVLRIDSPGGSAQASDDIWREVGRCRAAKPVIVSMADAAASGGYYVAVAADSIVAMPATLTGSIGIYGGKFNVRGAFEKLGLTVETVSRGAHAEMLSPYRDFSPEEAARFQQNLEAFYRGFVGRVARGRRMSEAEVDSLGQGRVWTGVAARRLGLVDRLGGLTTALEMARAAAKLPADEELVVERFPRVRRSLLERWLEDFVLRDEDAEAWLAVPPMLRAWASVARLPAGEPLAIMPFQVDVR
jgi:protease IV